MPDTETQVTTEAPAEEPHATFAWDACNTHPADDFGEDAEPGIYLGVPDEAYFAHSALSRSDLLPYSEQCPIHFVHRLHHGSNSKDSDSMSLGSAMHARLLQPDVFDTYKVAPEQCQKTKNSGERCTHSAKALYPDEGNEGLWVCGTHARYIKSDPSEAPILSASDKRAIDGMWDALHEHPFSARLIEDTIATEITCLWVDEYTGLAFKCRIDMLVVLDGHPLLVDLKTAGSAHPDDFKRAITKTGLWLQPAFYKWGFMEASGIPQGQAEPDDFIFMVVESAPPHVVDHYNLSPLDMEAVEKHLGTMIDDIAQDMDDGHWQGYTDEPVTSVALSPWQRQSVGLPT